MSRERWKSGKGLRPEGLSYRYNARCPPTPEITGALNSETGFQKSDRMTAREIVRLMNREDRKVAIAVGGRSGDWRAVVRLSAGFERRAGCFMWERVERTVGVLDAADVLPRLGRSPRDVQALIAEDGARLLMR